MTSFSISMFLWFVVRLIFPQRYFVTRPPEQHFRSRKEIWYVTKRDLWSFRRWSIIVVTIIIVFVIWVYLQNNNLVREYWDQYLLLLSIAISVIITVIVYDKTKTSSEEQEIRIRRIEGTIHSKFPYSIKSKETAKFQIIFALEGILYNLEDMREEIKNWSRESDKNKKEIIKNRCIYMWKSVQEYGNSLDDQSIVSNIIFDEEIVDLIKKISIECKKELEFDESKNYCVHTGVHSVIVNALLILDEFNIITQYRYML